MRIRQVGRKKEIVTSVGGVEHTAPWNPLNESLTIHGERLDDHGQEILDLRIRVRELENRVARLDADK